ncbi:Cubilin [Lamellibrachia satsuma]|nr:Cubilin [Lamellibrachia satsuma]
MLLQRVQLHFVSFDLEAERGCNYDSVRIYDGRGTSAPLMRTICGDSLPGDVTSSGNTMFVRFQTDDSGTRSGFSIYYSTFIPVDGCFGSPAEMGGSEGTFSISDEQTLNYMTCSWKIQVEHSKLVQLHFLSFDLVASTNCSTTNVKIYDGNDALAPLLHSFCGDSLPGDVTSSGNTVLVHFMHFKLNSANTYDGFKIYYSVFIPVEGCFGSPAEIRGDVGTFGISENQTLSYMTCSWKIQVEPSKLVQLHFLNFDLGASTDCSTASVKIYDGNDTSAPLLSSFCGNSLPGDVISSGNTVFVYFKTGCSNTSGGFSIYYSAFTPVEGCVDSPVELKGSNGTFGISEYHNKMRCSWKIQVEPAKRIRLHFLIFELEDCSDCVCDSVDIADVDGRTTPVMSSFCGSTVPNDIFTVSNRVLVYFRTDGFTSHYGFRIYYSATFPVQGCRGSPITKQGPKGTIGINEIHYDNYMTCGWKIQVDATKRVRLHFLSFEVEASTDCSFDSINIYDGHDTSAPLLQTFCGHNVPGDVASSGNTIFVRFKTDHSGTYGGFNIYYSTFVPVHGCPGTPVEMRGNKGTFGISDDQYHNNMRCSWKIQVDPFKRVRLQFLGFHLQESIDCSYDSIKIYDGKDTTASLVRTVCGTTVPEDITSSTHTLFVHFSSGETSTNSAFQIYYSDLVVPEGCHGNAITMRGPRGNIGVTQVQYTNYMRCSWNIQVDSTDIVKFEFVEFSVESCCDSVTVYDGDSRSAPLLGTFHGNTLPRDVSSTNNTMLVCFESDGSGTWNGFEINYTALPLATADCQPGEMNDGQNCTKCPRGTYQPDRWMTACVDCPLNHTTLAVGSVNITECKWLCQPGFQLDEVTGQCVVIPRGLSNNKALNIVTSHLTTPGGETTSSSGCCQENCTVGQMIVGTTCQKCSVGTYQDKICQTMCIPCGDNMTTLRQGATSITECMPDCQPGEMSDGQLCKKCPRGTYQADRWMTACTDCPWNFTTRDVGSISIVDCKWQCESGFQLDEVRDECVLCPRGFFKDKTLHVDCQSCPNHLTTPGRGSRSASDCSQGEC